MAAQGSQRGQTTDAGTQHLEQVRDQLVKESRAAKSKPSAASPAPFPLASYAKTIDLLLIPLASQPVSTVVTGLPLQVLENLLSLSLPALDAPELRSLYTPTVLSNLASTLYRLYSAPSTVVVLRCKSCLVLLIAVEEGLHADEVEGGERVVLQRLKERLLADPWLSKRSLFVFEILVGAMSVRALAEFAEGEGGTEEGVLRKLVEVMVVSDEHATAAGKVAISWIDKVWGTAPSGFWTAPVREGLATSARARSNLSLYLLPLLFKSRPETFLSLLHAGAFLDPAAPVATLESTLAILSAASAQGLVDSQPSPSPPPASSNHLSLPLSLLSTTLTHLSPTLRIASFNLLFHTSTPTTLIPTPTFPLLQAFYTASLGEEDPNFAMGMRSATGKLLSRLRDSCGKLDKSLEKGKQASVASAGNPEAFLDLVQEFLEGWTTELVHSLNPAKPFRIKSNALKLLDQVLQTGVDRRFAVTPSLGLSPPSAWPNRISLDLLNPSTTATLLRLLQSTYTSLRVLAISVLERFPSPLPGYEGPEGRKRVERELLEPALRMARSGREAEASAGAEVVALVGKTMGVQGWDLGLIGGWSTVPMQSADEDSFLTSLMDLLDLQLVAYTTDLGRAASTTPIHGTLLTLRHLFATLPPSLTLAHRPLFLRALAIVEKVWDVTRVVLAAQAPEGPMVEGVTDTEEARALMVEAGVDGEEGEAPEVEGTGGPRHKVLLSATWRAMKESSELVETLLWLPSEAGSEQLRKIWHLDEIEHIGDLYATWLALIRHRGAFMAIHPCYSRVCSTLLRCKGWPEVQALPVAWLDIHLDSIVSKKISITRRSAGIPYCILGILTPVLPTNRLAYNKAFSRLFEIAESKSTDILDESRVHAMNTIHTAVLDGKISAAVGPYIERGFLLSISMFWSPNWICRNVAMILYASLVTRTFNARRTNLDRNHASLVQRVGTADFFGKYPTIHGVLKSELKFSTREHLDDLPTSNLHSSLFSVLMLLSLLQSPNRVDQTVASDSDAFLPFVKACTKSRVWKIRDAAGDALTGIVPPAEVASVVLDLLEGLRDCKENELHGRLVGALRLLEGSAPLSATEATLVNTRIDNLAPSLLLRHHSFAVRTTFLNLARVNLLSNGHRSISVFELAHSELDASRSWDTTVTHLPSAENFVASAFLFALAFTPAAPTLVASGLATPLLSVQRAALAHLSTEGDLPSAKFLEELRPALVKLAVTEAEASECRIAALEILVDVEWSKDEAGLPALVELLGAQHRDTVIVPLREALLPLIAKLADTVAEDVAISSVLEKIDLASGVDQSVESREASVRALKELIRPVALDQQELFGRLVLRLLQDDDPTVRSIAEEIVEAKFSGGVPLADRPAVEVVLGSVGPASLAYYQEELAANLALLSKPSSLLFAVEKPNIFRDEIIETEYLLRSSSPSSAFGTLEEVDATLQALGAALRSSFGENLDNGPLRLFGNELVTKWAFRLVSRRDVLVDRQGGGKKQTAGVDRLEGELEALVDVLRRTYL